MTAGRLQTKKGYYYALLGYKDEEGNRKVRWVKTGVAADKGNKKKAENILTKYRNDFDENTGKFFSEQEDEISIVAAAEPPEEKPKLLFGDYLIQWLERHRPNIEENTYYSYRAAIHDTIAPYFNGKNITLEGLIDEDIKEFYAERQKTVTANTVWHYHANIRKALEDAFIKGTIPNNPAARIKKPKVEQFIGAYYNVHELLQLFEYVKGKDIEFAVRMGACYGLRRSEAVGLKWDAVDFYYNTITIRHAVVKVATGTGVRKTIQKDRVKTKKSYRTLPLLPEVVDMLHRLKAEQKNNIESYGNGYNKKYLAYICVDNLGNLMNPDNVSKKFKRLIKSKELKDIRFHDLRHSCATMLRRMGVPLEDIQHWLGHSTVKTTEMIYAHFDNVIHLKSAAKISEAFKSTTESDLMESAGLEDVEDEFFAEDKPEKLDDFEM